MAYQTTANRMMDEVVSISAARRSDTRVMPTGASQPPICSVWMPSTSAMMSNRPLTTMVTSRVKNATWRWVVVRLPKTKQMAAASIGRMTGSGRR